MASRNLVKLFYKLSDRNLEDSYLNLLDPHAAVKQRFETNNTEMDMARGDLIVPINYLQPEQIRNAVKNNIWIIFVRNPLERLLSAWNDKFKENDDAFYRKVEDKILSQVRGSKRRNDSDYLSLYEFFTFLKVNTNQSLKLDVHWKPMFRICDVCAIDFDFIGKLETFERDVDVLLDKLNVTKGNTNVADKMRPPLLKSEDPRYQELMETVPRQLTEFVLTNIYKNDYDLFGYDLEKDLEHFYGMKDNDSQG